MTDDRDDRMDEMLRLGARDYNQPGSVPREEIWARIAGARGAGGGTRSAPQSSVASRDPRPARRVSFWPGIGIGAAAVLVLGITIGRRMERGAPATSEGPKGDRTVAVTPPKVTPRPDSEPSAITTRDSLVAAIRAETQKTDQTVRQLAAAKPERPAARTPALPSDRSAADESSALAYHLVVLQHLAGSEAMITAFRTSARRGEVDAQLASWSRDLLGTTRMLEASPAADDPTMKRLLEDLDLVIGQIVIYVTRGTNNPEELDLIEQSINSRGVITKLRSNVPARTLSAGS
jgi:hypothetical protein